jgi:hypothetical protein
MTTSFSFVMRAGFFFTEEAAMSSGSRGTRSIRDLELETPARVNSV